MHRGLRNRSDLSVYVVSAIDLLALFATIITALKFTYDLAKSFFTSDDPPNVFAIVLSPFLILVATYIVGIATVSLVLGILKLIGLMAMALFGKLIALAGIAAIGGTLSTIGYFVVVKALEKLFGQRVEDLLKKKFGHHDSVDTET